MANESVIIIGASARAAAMSALRAGLQPWCIDLFADRDLTAIADVKQCSGGWPGGVIRLLDDAPRDVPVLFTGAMENHRPVVRRIEKQFPLLGPGANLMRRLRDPKLLDGVWDNSTALPDDPHWLMKHRRSAGGSGVRPWSGKPPDRHHYLQRFFPGTPLSVVLRGDGHSLQVFGSTTQIIGDPQLGASGFTFAGNLHPAPPLDPTQLQAIIDRLPPDLAGIVGLDLIAGENGQLHLVEINPRYTASVELIEHATGRNVFHPHPASRTDASINAKAVIYAKATCVVGDLLEMFPPGRVADIPPVGQTIAPGRPICTLLSDRGLDGLHAMAHELYTHLR